MKKLAIFLSAILILNLAAPAASAYASPTGTAIETVYDEMESIEESSVEESQSVVESSTEETETTVVETEETEEIEETEEVGITEEESTSEIVVELPTEEVSEELYAQEVMEESGEEEDGEAIESPETDFEWSGTTITKYIGADTEVVIPAKAVKIAREAFAGNETVESVTISENVNEIGYWAFHDCSNLKTVNIETTKLGTKCSTSVFSGCSINSVTFPEEITYIPNNIFSGAGFESGISIVIPENVTEVGTRAFDGASNLGEITFAGNKVTTINEYAFSGTGIETIILPELLKTIGREAFANCDNLFAITIPNQVNEIGYWAFHSCDNLTKVILPAKVKSIDKSAIPKNSFLKIYAPKDSASYKWAKKNGYNVAEIYTITYKLNGGINGKGNPTNYELGDSLTFTDPTKTGFEFVGWYKDSEFKKPFTYTETTKGNLTLHAKWKAIAYTIHYETNGGTLAKNSPESYKITAEKELKNPTKTGYTFAGWYTNRDLTTESKIKKIKKGSTGDITLYAGWTANVYKIKFAKNAKNATGTMDTITGVVYDTEIILTDNAYERKGYTFAGWNTKANGKGTVIADGAIVSNLNAQNNGTATLYAVWEAIPYTITYYLNDGDNHVKNPATYTVAQSITLKKPTKTGYTFKGWYKDAELTKKITEIKAGSIGDIDVYAKWQVNKYKVKFDANKGNGKMAALKNCEYDKVYELPDNTFTRSGYTFKGWNTKANGSGIAYENMAAIEKLTSTDAATVTLYAQWEKN